MGSSQTPPPLLIRHRKALAAVSRRLRFVHERDGEVLDRDIRRSVLTRDDRIEATPQSNGCWEEELAGSIRVRRSLGGWANGRAT